MKILLLGQAANKFADLLKQYGYAIMFDVEKISKKFLEKNDIEFVISYGYRHLIDKECIDWMCGRMINLHISLLPWNRGADPNLWSFLELSPAGVTIHRIEAEVDSGKILLQQQVEHDVVSDTLATSYKRLEAAIEDLLIENVQALLADTIKEKKQIGLGSYHRSVDKNKYLHLLTNGWDTPVVNLIGKAR